MDRNASLSPFFRPTARNARKTKYGCWETYEFLELFAVREDFENRRFGRFAEHKVTRKLLE